MARLPTLLLLLPTCLPTVLALELAVPTTLLVEVGAGARLACEAGGALDICSWSRGGEWSCRGAECGIGGAVQEVGEQGCTVSTATTLEENSWTFRFTV